MKSLVCDKAGVLRMEDRPMPVAVAGEVLIRVRRIGICGTDMHIFRGTQPYLAYPRVMGHELSGEVVEALASSHLKKGDPVYIMPYLSCGTCVACRVGKTNCCTNISVLGVHRDGGMTEYLSLPEQFVFKADGISLDDAAMIEFLAIGAHAVRRAKLEKGQRILVVGAGPIGIAVMLFAGLQGVDVTVLDSREDRLEFAREVLHVNNAITVGEGDKERLAAISDQEFFHVVFDATGNINAMERGLEFVAHGGTYVLVSIVRDTFSFADPEFHKRETSLLGSRNATAEDFDVVLNAMRSGKVPTHLLNTHRTTLDEFANTLPQWMDPSAGVIKAIVEV